MKRDAEWIVPFQGRNTSLGLNQNFLWRQGNIYLMDNHRAAAWCWAQHEISLGPHSIMHLDAHYDAAPIREESAKDLAPLNSLEFEEYSSIMFDDPDIQVPLFTWDNYNSLYQAIHGSNVESWLFSTHKIGSAPTFDFQEVEPSSLISHLTELPDDKEWILNLDLDLFRSQDGDRFPSEQRPELYALLGQIFARSDRQILTVATSPECCGSWEVAEELCSEFCDSLELNFQLE